MSRKLYTVYALKRVRDGMRYIVYKWEHGKVQPTYYSNRKMAESDKDWVCR